MKALQACLICIVAGTAFLAPIAHSGWSEDMRLTDGGYEDDPQVVARNDTVHVVWQRFVETQVSYIRSIDGGYNWGESRDFVDIGHMGARPDLSLGLERLLVTWSDNDTISPNPFPNVGYVISEGGEYWPPPEYVFPPRFPGLMDLATTICGDSIYVAYYANEEDSTGYIPIRFLYSSNLGESWTEEVTVGHSHDYINGLLIAKCLGSIYIVWAGKAYPEIVNHEVVVTVSHDGGQSWSDVEQLSPEDYHVSQHSCIACDQLTGKVAVGWMEAGYPGDLYLRLTTDGGYSWSQQLRATYHDMVADPSLAIASDTLWAVWSDKDPSHGWQNDEIAFSKSTDCGLTWSPHERITFADGWSYTPWISYDSGKLHVVWWEHRRPPHEGNEIYYKRYIPNPTAVEDNKPVLPAVFTMSACPNPFNSDLRIFIESQEPGSIVIYDILGRVIKEFEYESGLNLIQWDPTDALGNKVSSGIYFARARGAAAYSTIKLIYLR